MGAENNAMLSYLDDDKRFADLFNQMYFKGQQVADAGELAEALEVYHGKPGEKGGQRTHDIKRRMKSGKELKILAVESQSDVNYIMHGASWITTVGNMKSRYGEPRRRAGSWTGRGSGSTPMRGK